MQRRHIGWVVCAALLFAATFPGQLCPPVQPAPTMLSVACIVTWKQSRPAPACMLCSHTERPTCAFLVCRGLSSLQ